MNSASPREDDANRVRDFDGSDRTQDDEQKKDVEIRRVRRENFLVRLLSDPDGREWIMELMRDWNVFGPMQSATTPTGHPDQIATAFLSGLSKAGWRIWAELDEASPELASAMRRNK